APRWWHLRTGGRSESCRFGAGWMRWVLGRPCSRRSCRSPCQSGDGAGVPGTLPTLARAHERVVEVDRRLLSWRLGVAVAARIDHRFRLKRARGGLTESGDRRLARASLALRLARLEQRDRRGRILAGC